MIQRLNTKSTLSGTFAGRMQILTHSCNGAPLPAEDSMDKQESLDIESEVLL